MDVYEELELRLLPDGLIASCEVVGKVDVQTFLTGLPLLKMGLNNNPSGVTARCRCDSAFRPGDSFQ